MIVDTLEFDAKVIVTLRHALGYTQVQFAKAVGVNRSTIQNWEYELFKPLPVFQRKLRELAKQVGNKSK